MSFSVSSMLLVGERLTRIDGVAAVFILLSVTIQKLGEVMNKRRESVS